MLEAQMHECKYTNRLQCIQTHWPRHIAKYMVMKVTRLFINDFQSNIKRKLWWCSKQMKGCKQLWQTCHMWLETHPIQRSYPAHQQDYITAKTWVCICTYLLWYFHKRIRDRAYMIHHPSITRLILIAVAMIRSMVLLFTVCVGQKRLNQIWSNLIKVGLKVLFYILKQLVHRTTQWYIHIYTPK